MRKMICTFMCMLLIMVPCFASAASDRDSGPVANAKLVNVTTGEITPLEVKDISLPQTRSGGDGTFVKSYEVTAHFDLPSTRSVITGTDGADVKGVINVQYSKTGTSVKISRVWGSWTPQHSMIKLSSRQVFVYRPDPKNGYETYSYNPSSNSFDYSFNWSATSGDYAGASSQVMVSVDDMGQHWLSVDAIIMQ